LPVDHCRLKRLPKLIRVSASKRTALFNAPSNAGASSTGRRRENEQENARGVISYLTGA
jgi:hypothetical protein